MLTLRSDLLMAVRAMRTNSGYTLAAVLTMAIGIGANTAVFGLAHHLLVRPVPGVHNPDQLIAMSLMPADRGGAGLISHRELEQMRTASPALEGLAGYQDLQLNVAVPGGDARRIEAAVVSDGYFDVLGSPVSFGRALNAAAGTGPVAVVSHTFWRTTLAGAADAVGSTITVNGAAFTVIGVTRAGFSGTSRAGRTEVWIPVSQHRIALPFMRDDLLTSTRSTVYFGIVGRLKAGHTIAQAEQQVNAARTALLAGTTSRQARWSMVARAGMEPTPWLRERVDKLVTTLAAGVALLLILTCANVGNLMLARASARQRELATRLALGASRAGLARLLLTESVVLSTAGGVVALGFTWLVARMFDGEVLLPGVVTLGLVTVNWAMLGVAFLLSLVVAVVAAVAPLVMATRADLRASSRTFSGTSRVQKALTVAQVAVSVTLLLASVLLVRSMQARLAIPLGFDPSTVLSLSLEPAMQRYTPERTDAFYRDLMTRVRQVSGVRAVGLAWLAPFSQGASNSSLWREGGSADDAVSGAHNLVSPGFLDAMGIPLLAGRDFRDAEFMKREVPGDGVVILTSSLAQRLFGDGSAVGRRVTMRFPEGRVRTVVGVIADQRQHRVGTDTADLILEPFGQSFVGGFAALQVSTSAPVPDVVAGITAAVRELDATLPLYQVRTLDTAVRQSLSEERLISQTVTLLAALAMFVAAVGLAAVLARAVISRRREFGVRMACGATPRRVATQVAREALWIASVGIAVGLVVSTWFVRLIGTRLYGVTAADPLSIVLVVGGVLLIGTGAAIIPARRAAHVDPASVLR